MKGVDDIAFPALPSPRLRKALRFVLDNIGDAELSPNALADEMGISRRLLYLEFEQIGLTPKAFIQDLRLKLCHHYLMKDMVPEVNLTQIALQYGFSDGSCFSRAFKARFGIPPSQLRNWSEL